MHCINYTLRIYVNKDKCIKHGSVNMDLARLVQCASRCVWANSCPGCIDYCPSFVLGGVKQMPQ